MVDITPRIAQGRQLINGYGGGGFIINHVRIEGSVIVLPERSVAWSVTEPSQLLEVAFAEVMAEEGIEILLVGTGKKMVALPPELRMALREKRIAFEFMDTGAACRTYNILLAEERKVAAALIAV